MIKLRDLVGTEGKSERLGGALREFVTELRPAAVGAYQVTCSDETERECAEAFHRWFADRMLPDLKPVRRAAFQTVNLGARYEWGAIRIAEEHYATPESRDAVKLLVVKINAHVAVRNAPEGPEYGWIDRYGVESTCCGALAALLEGSQLPAVRELAQTFSIGDRNRVDILHDLSRVPIRQRALRAAIVDARLQSQRAVLDIEEHRPNTPTMFLVLPCVTINRPGPDTELLVGDHGIDWTEDSAEIKYSGLGDDPAAYRIRHERGVLVVED